MATIKIELYTSKTLNDGRHPIMIRVTKDGKRARLAVGSASVEEWDDVKMVIKPKGRKTHMADNIKIEEAYYKYKLKFNELKKNNRWTVEDFFEPEEEKFITFQDFAKSYLESLDQSKLLYIGTVNNRLNKIYRYAPKPFGIEDINEKWLNGFVRHCQIKEVNKTKDKNKGNSKNTINHAIRLIKTIANFSGKSSDALNRYKVVYDKNIRAKLTEEELNLFINHPIPDGTPKSHARDIFLLQYYSRGMRIGDALRLKKSYFKDQYLAYTTRKTGKIHKIKVVSKLEAIINKYIEGDGYLFPFIKGENLSEQDLNTQVKYRTKDVNRLLKEILAELEIDKPISTHIARHTFASIADKKLGGDLKELQGMLGHSSRAMTEVYIRDLRKFDELDDAADKVFE